MGDEKIQVVASRVREFSHDKHNSFVYIVNNTHFIISAYEKKTRCSPRTRMLTRMLMVQMSKHMDLQSRRTLFCNSLVEQACTYFPCYQSAVWSVECRVWSVKCRVWSVKCGVWSVKCRVWSVDCKVWSENCGVGSVKWKSWSVKCKVWSVECKV